MKDELLVYDRLTDGARVIVHATSSRLRRVTIRRAGQADDVREDLTDSAVGELLAVLRRDHDNPAGPTWRSSTGAAPARGADGSSSAVRPRSRGTGRFSPDGGAG